MNTHKTLLLVCQCVARRRCRASKLLSLATLLFCSPSLSVSPSPSLILCCSSCRLQMRRHLNFMRLVVVVALFSTFTFGIAYFTALPVAPYDCLAYFNDAIGSNEIIVSSGLCQTLPLPQPLLHSLSLSLPSLSACLWSFSFACLNIT